jgi:CDP-glucose 4,6-dehydratase
METHTIGDVRDISALEKCVQRVSPEIVFHLAAQPLVRESYRFPLETYATNAMGTANLLESLRKCTDLRAVVNVTTDKCYLNREWPWGYRETDHLGGDDPYSSSKACAELITSAYRRSYFSDSGIGIGTARAGNVIGGGDWAMDRLVPDFYRAAAIGAPLEVRSPNAVRPWQHVLEPLSGYMLLAQRLFEVGDGADSDAWNFGPDGADAWPVDRVLDELVALVPGSRWRHTTESTVRETERLELDSGKARRHLLWRPRWNIALAIRKTADWHARWIAGGDMPGFCREQIREYLAVGTG